MSGELREAAERIASSVRLPRPGSTVRSELDKAVERLSHRKSGSARDLEGWDDFLERIGVLRT